MADLKRRIEAQNNGDDYKVENELNAVRKRLESYVSEEKRLLKLFRYESITEEYLLHELA